MNDSREAVRAFHRLYYESGIQARTEWLGVTTRKCPLDLWVYQEIIFGKRPDLILETGTAEGGSAYFLATMCDAIGSGRIVTVDIRQLPGRPEHPRITYVHGDSAADEIVSLATGQIRPGESVMVVLDSDHHRDHVLRELHAYAPLVSPGQYLVVEDTNVNGNPVRPDWGPGPAEALDTFLQEELGRQFTPDPACEKFLMTFNPRGYFVRTS